MRKEFFTGDARKRKWNVWINDWPEADDVGVYSAPRVFEGRSYDNRVYTPEQAIKTGEALIAAGRRAIELQANRDKRGGRTYDRFWKESA